MGPEVDRFLVAIGSTLLWTFVSILLVGIMFELMERRYHLLKEIFEENSIAAAILAGSMVLGIVYTVVQIVTH